MEDGQSVVNASHAKVDAKVKADVSPRLFSGNDKSKVVTNTASASGNVTVGNIDQSDKGATCCLM